ncbi:MAG: DUF58 domain-containing protein [Gammaproteobacteria bacterium]|nr:DUF58 domain-containing protein [Gammaproteobacteria bacterium]
MSLSRSLQMLTRAFVFPSQARLKQPLLTPAEVLALRQQAHSSALSILTQRDSHHAQLGDVRSPQRGSGMDFDESRPYVAGDDRRFINWRLLARTGEMYLKLFHEERRSQLFLLLDRRATMRMGSQGCLKVTQAARLATLLSCLAKKEKMAVGAAVMNTTTHWHRPMSGEKALHRLIEDYIAPAPPLEDDADADLQQILSHLQSQLPAGSVVVLISDFQELDERHEAALWALVSKHRVIALTIHDPLERQLPKQKAMRFSSPHDGQIIELDGRDAEQAQRYQQAMQHHRNNIAQRLCSLGVETHSFSTIDNVFDAGVLREHLYDQ